MRLAVLLVAAAVLVVPVSLFVGGHNGATVLGIVLAMFGVVLAIAAAPSKEER